MKDVKFYRFTRPAGKTAMDKENFVAFETDARNPDIKRVYYYIIFKINILLFIESIWRYDKLSIRIIIFRC